MKMNEIFWYILVLQAGQVKNGLVAAEEIFISHE